MKIIYMMVLNDISPEDFRKMIDSNDIAYDKSTFIKFDNRPGFMECMEIDLIMEDIPKTEWKHVLKIKDYIKSFEVIEYISSFGKTISNI